jgi:peptidoglycan hydrolase-like protein with peptidoglycan-binding domain
MAVSRKRKKISAARRLIILIIKRLMLVKRRSWIIIFSAAAIVVAAIILVSVLGSAPPARQASALDLPAQTLTPAPVPTLTPTPIPTTTPTPDQTLKRGDENERVQHLQQRLMDLGYFDQDETTQLYGPYTESAVKLFQRQHGLEQTGVADQETLNWINSADAKKYTLLEGTRGDDVNNLQRKLIELGYIKKETGYYGTETAEAIKAFQKRNGLTQDGKAGEHTLDVIYSPDAKPSPEKVQEQRRKANINEMLEAAEKQLGDPYVSGKEGPNSFDCSGLVHYCLKQAGSNRGRYNAQGYANVTEWKKIESMSDLQKGDLMFFWSDSKRKIGHVAIYIGKGMVIDASSSNGKVVKRSCTTPWFKKYFRYARRPW